MRHAEHWNYILFFQVLLLAAFISCIMKKPDLDDDEENFDEGNCSPPTQKDDMLSASQIDLQGKALSHIDIAT